MLNNQVVVYAAPAVEPVTLTDVKSHLRLDSSSVADNLASAQSIVPGSHIPAAAYSLKGTGVDVLGYGALVIIEAGAAGGTVDVKIQESDTDSDSAYADWTGGAFTQITTSNDNATYEKEYTGRKQYIRVVCTVGTAACEFGVSILRQGGDRSDDSLLSSLITTVRRSTELLLGRSLITQTLDVYYDGFPPCGFLEVPYPPLISVITPYLQYTDSDDTAATFSSDYYYVDVISEPGRIVLKYGESWPSFTSRTYWPVSLRVTAGYGAAGSYIPNPIKQFMLLNLADLYEQRGNLVPSKDGVQELKLGMGLVTDYRIY